MVKATRKCSIDWCENKHDARGYCKSHWHRWKRHGDPLAGRTYDGDYSVNKEELFWQHVKKTPGCWIWVGPKNTLGYGRLRGIQDSNDLAYRFSYELHNGPITPGMMVDHLCHEPSCVNPDHLREATHQQNMWNRKGASKNSKSGVRGVYWSPTKNRWIAGFTYKKKKHYVGSFKDLEEAAIAVEDARSKMPK